MPRSRRYRLGFDTAATMAGAFVGLMYSPLVAAVVYLTAVTVLQVDDRNLPPNLLTSIVLAVTAFGAAAFSYRSWREEQFLSRAYATSTPSPR